MIKKGKIISCLLAGTALLTIHNNVFANSDTILEKVTEFKGSETVIQTNEQLNPNYIETTKDKTVVTKKISEIMGRVGASLPTSYRTMGLKVKNQKDRIDTQECWAFSFTSALEAYNIKHKGSTAIYSPRHIDYSCTRTFTDGIKENAFNREIGISGGNFMLATSYAASGQGPVLEKDMPFSDILTRISLKDLEKEVKQHVEGYVRYEAVFKKYENNKVTCYSDSGYTVTKDITSFRNRVKTQIQNNGGVLTTIYEGDRTNNVYVKTMANPVNHAVFIVGWDDNYKAEGWDNPGAYIALNSYGENSFDNGYIYISYDDIFVEMGMFGITKTSDKDFDNVYEHDQLGITNAVDGSSFKATNADGSTSTFTQTREISAVNIFDRVSLKPESLTEVGISSLSYQKAEIYYTDEFSEEKEYPINFKLVKAVPETLSPGYTAVKLDTPIELTTEKYAICVRFIEDNEEDIATVAVEAKATNNPWWDFVVGNVGESYYIDVLRPTGVNTYWRISMNGVEALNAGIKAFTTDGNKPELPAFVTSTEYNIEYNMITKVPLGTTVEEFKSNITVNQNYKIVDTSGNEVTTPKMKTGYKVKVGGDEYPVSVLSDISGDGEVDILDLARIRAYTVRSLDLTGVYYEAADLSGDGEVDILDLARMRVLVNNRK